MLPTPAIVAIFPVFVALGATQSLEDLADQVPKCAMTCIQNASPEVGCPKLDSVCHCEKQDELLPAAERCFASTCTEKEVDTCNEVVPQVCDLLLSNSTPPASPTASETPTGTPGAAAPVSRVGLRVAGVVAAAAHFALV